MADARWFLMVDGEVQGPFNELTVQDQLTLHPRSLIWGKGQSEWLNQDQWKKFLSQYQEAMDRTRVFADRTWKVKINDQEYQPMGHDQMLQLLKQQSDLKNVRIWTEGYSDWKEVYQIHKIMDDLGISRRAHPRVPIMGEIELDGAAGHMHGRLLSISEGGLGIMGSPKWHLGDKFRAVIKSPNIVGPLHCSAEVVYLEPSGYTGMKFISLPAEQKNTIVDYVKKFVGERP